MNNCMNFRPVEWPNDVPMSKHHVVNPGSENPFSLYTVLNGKREKLKFYNKENGSTRFDFRVLLELADFTNDRKYYSELLADSQGRHYFLDPRQGNQYLQVICLNDSRYVRYVAVTYNYVELDKSLHSIRPMHGSIMQRLSDLELICSIMKEQVENVHSVVHGGNPVNLGLNTFAYATDPDTKNFLDYNMSFSSPENGSQSDTEVDVSTSSNNQQKQEYENVIFTRANRLKNIANGNGLGYGLKFKVNSNLDSVGNDSVTEQQQQVGRQSKRNEITFENPIQVQHVNTTANDLNIINEEVQQRIDEKFNQGNEENGGSN